MIIHLLDDIVVLPSDNSSLHLHCRCELTALNSEVLIKDAPLLNLIDSGHCLLVNCIQALLNVASDLRVSPCFGYSPGLRVESLEDALYLQTKVVCRPA